jgi:hypothetical protein
MKDQANNNFPINLVQCLPIIYRERFTSTNIGYDILLKAFNQVEEAVVRRDCLRNVSRASSLLRENISLDGREQTCYQTIRIGWID